jgi:transcriptional regulator with XRE-family HTH domain
MARQRASYGSVLKRLRADRGVSQRALAGAIGVSQPLVARTETDARRPEGAEEIAAVARALSLGADEYDELLLLAGYWPSAFLALGPDDPTLRAVARALADGGLPPAAREEIRRAIDGLMGAVAAVWEAGSARSVGEPGEGAAPAASASRRSGAQAGRHRVAREVAGQGGGTLVGPESPRKKRFATA